MSFHHDTGHPGEPGTVLELTLQERVRKFNLGTPTALHVGTHELVNDLWRELESMSRPVRQHSGDRSAHTPGPWRVLNWADEKKGLIAVVGSSQVPEHICEIFPFGARTIGRQTLAEHLTNASLIAAAPDMLVALELMLKHSCVADSDPDDKDPEDHDAERSARAAIAKATGA